MNLIRPIVPSSRATRAVGGRDKSVLRTYNPHDLLSMRAVVRHRPLPQPEKGRALALLFVFSVMRRESSLSLNAKKHRRRPGQACPELVKEATGRSRHGLPETPRVFRPTFLRSVTIEHNALRHVRVWHCGKQSLRFIRYATTIHGCHFS